MLAAVDFHKIEDRHAEIHKRLLNWARWCHGGGAPSTAPMFRLYRTPARARTETQVLIPIDHRDASKIAKGVTALPEPHRKALHWSYIKPINPRRAAQEQGVTMDTLARLVRDGRTMLINKGV